MNEHDLLIFAVGYEQRSAHVAREYMGSYKKGLGIRFNVHEDLAFADNLAWAVAQENIVVHSAESEVAASDLTVQAVSQGGARRFLVDVSSFPRPYLAAIISGLWDSVVSCNEDIHVDLVYSVPVFSPPPSEHGPVVSFGAVHPQFAGSGAGTRGLATLIGIGYEPELALAAQQVLDPAITWLGVPRSADTNFDGEVADANQIILDVVDSSNIWTYDVPDPSSTFFELESIVSGLSRDHSVVLVPLGPKLFAAVCILVSLLHSAEVGVWRLSAGGLRIPKDQVASGPIYTLPIRLFNPLH